MACLLRSFFEVDAGRGEGEPAAFTLHQAHDLQVEPRLHLTEFGQAKRRAVQPHIDVNARSVEGGHRDMDGLGPHGGVGPAQFGQPGAERFQLGAGGVVSHPDHKVPQPAVTLGRVLDVLGADFRVFDGNQAVVRRAQLG